MFTQRNALFIALAITFTNLLLNVQGLALPLSQTQAVHSSYLKRNANITISAPMNPKHDLPGQTGVPLVQRDIPPPVLKAIETVGKFIKRDSLAERDIPPPVLKAIETVGKFIKRDSLAERDIPAPVLKAIETVGKLG
ncbi:hypothetical protein PGT21_026803 [Puccinia graminis f. sp. tritici]|uniref:Uncharacterized protein n=1 Tax=Puccinia graminis f. sp. tritici TaxID=56615 RepID=A0A5B0LXS3_PUCGR|nr:hypothetical protein PGTUg99_011377 [Puccinia graminis f. sp. tritici]KAA1104555.1 hypothetical protein PGT21_026803 [Puccinia graminis f. sp. tritici]